MKLLLSFSMLVLILYGCRRINDPVENRYGFEVVDTKMAEIKVDTPPKFSKRDTAEIRMFWQQFRKLLENNDLGSIEKLSSPEVYCPVYSNDLDYHDDNRPVSLFFFTHAPLRSEYISKFSSFLINDTPKIDMDSSGDHEINYRLIFRTFEKYRIYKIFKRHEFSFKKINNTIKFEGLFVYEEGWRYKFNQVGCDSLYFPLIRISQDSTTNFSSFDTNSNKLYSECLRDFKEPVLYNYRGEDDICRFIYLRSFHFPLIVRVQKHNGRYELTVKKYEDYKASNRPPIVLSDSEPIYPFQWSDLEAKVQKIDFANIPANDPGPAANDGARWILETNIKGKYHVIERQSPGYDRFKDCCLYLLSLSKLNIPGKAIY